MAMTRSSAGEDDSLLDDDTIAGYRRTLSREFYRIPVIVLGSEGVHTIYETAVCTWIEVELDDEIRKELVEVEVWDDTPLQ